MGPRDPWPRPQPHQGRALRRCHLEDRPGLCRDRRGLRLLWRHHAFRPRHGHQLPLRAGMTLDIERIRCEFPDRRIDYYPTVDSTMYAAAGCLVGTVVIAEEQTAGQGRHGHSWHSEAGAGIYCSIVLEPAPVLTLALG